MEPPSAGSAAANDLASLSLEQLQAKLGSSAAGLTPAEAKDRLARYGYNELPERRANGLLKFLAYFWGPIPWMIEVAAILSAVVRHWADCGIIVVLLVVNAVVAFWEEFQAGNAIAALKRNLALAARVQRQGQWLNVPARELVPGDVIRLRLGDIVAADAKLLAGDAVEIDQAALTGESLPVTRATGENVFSGSVVKQGEIDALVYATGPATYFGKTAGLVARANAPSHFQKAVLKIGDFLIAVAVLLVVLILLVALFRGDPWLETLQFALILTVAAIPVAMPTVLSVTMAAGARLLAAEQAIVSRLAAIEELAGMDVLCTDKTGTLTENKLSLGPPHPVGNFSATDLVLAAALASRREDRDPIDLAVLAGLPDAGATAGYRCVHFQPFDPVHKRTEATVVAATAAPFRVMKGAVQVVLAESENRAAVAAQVEQATADFAKRGFRSLGVARAPSDGPWQFLGVLPLYDPPRPDSKETIHTARQMGIQVKMVTGDQTAIAREIAHELDLGPRILDAQQFAAAAQLTAAQLNDTIENVDGFAQVFPEHKYHLVSELQARGHIVGMTGDGVNDAPALKKADCGIAVSGATDAARAAADMVLLTPGLSVIIRAIKESRKIFQRMTSYAIYRISETVRVLLFMTLSILVFNFYPVTAVMIVLLALLNDGAILSIAFDRVRYSNRPEVWNMPRVLGVSLVLGLTGVVASFGLFYFAERHLHLPRDMIQSLMYLKLSVAGHMTIFVTRTRGPCWSIRPSALLFWAVAGTQLVATLIAVYGVFMPAIGWSWAAAVWAYCGLWFGVNDCVKLWTYRLFDANSAGLLFRPAPAR